MFFDASSIHKYDLDEDKFQKLYKRLDASGNVMSDTKYYGLLINIAVAGLYTGDDNRNLDVAGVAATNPDFDNARMEVRNITVESGHVSE